MEIKTNHGIKLIGFYRGQVKQHCPAGKCKIYVPGVYPESCLTNPDTLPDAEQASPLFGGINRGNGMFSYPNKDSIVWCFFENGDQNRPVYFASTLGGELAVDTNGQGFSNIRDNISIDSNPEKDTTKTCMDSSKHMINCGDSRITIAETGQVTIECVKRSTENNSDDAKPQFSKIFIDEDGTIRIETS